MGLEISSSASCNGLTWVSPPRVVDTGEINNGIGRRWAPFWQCVSLLSFIFFWVANGELLQAISSGSTDRLSRTSSMTAEEAPYNHPAFITWFSYNFMMLSVPIFLIPDAISNQMSMITKKTQDNALQKVQLVKILCDVFAMFQQWPGALGWRKALCGCVIIVYILHMLNILMMIGLECISVALSNAVFQLQAVFCVGLSVVLLKDTFTQSQAMGMIVASVGVSGIVLPPLLKSSGDDAAEASSTCRISRAPMLLGIAATVSSAIIGGAYLVSWRIFDEYRQSTRLELPTQNQESSHPSPMLGLMDTQRTVAMLGVTNFVAGWPMLVVSHLAGFDLFQWPPTLTCWRWLLLNGLVEFLFDASCAIAIYMTSPVTVATVSPLTIPLAALVDHFLYSFAKEFDSDKEEDYSNDSHMASMLLGTVIILIGVYWMERKPSGIEQRKKT